MNRPCGIYLNFLTFCLKGILGVCWIFYSRTSFLGKEKRACHCWCLYYNSSKLCSKRTSNERTNKFM